MQYLAVMCNFISMKLGQKILLLLTLLLMGGSVVQAGPSTAEQHDASIQPAAQGGAQSTHPLDQPNLFNIYHSAESSGNLINNSPVPSLSGDERDDNAKSRMAALAIKQQVSTCLHIFEISDRRAVVLKLIYPFHTFL